MRRMVGKEGMRIRMSYMCCATGYGTRCCGKNDVLKRWWDGTITIFVTAQAGFEIPMEGCDDDIHR